jgi:hypothetical protein
MKNILYLVLLFVAISCSSNAEEPDPIIAYKYQSPFGADTVDVKLKKVTRNGMLLIEYSYTNGYLSGFKKYVAFSKPRFYSTGVFTRNAGVPVKFDIAVADFSPETEFVSDDQKPRSTFQFNAAKTDSTREISQQEFFTPGTFNRSFLFNQAGFITQQSVSPSKGDEYVTTYVRNQENNVAQTWRLKKSGNIKTDKSDYLYDTNPNPFFKLGIDWEGDFSNYAISPNNISNETIYNADNRGVKSTYEYEYLPNGYPKKITIKRSFININGEEELTTPVVFDLEYY